LSTQPKKTSRKKSVKQGVRQDAFKQGIALLEQSKLIADPASRREAERAAVRYFIKDAIVPLTPQYVLSFITIITIIETAICIMVILKLPLLLNTAIIIVTSCFWFTLTVIALALGHVFSEAMLAKLMTTAFGKLIEKISILRSGNTN
jgi:hypothetical protein